MLTDESPACAETPPDEASGPAVFATAHLVWLDAQSGDELAIEIVGPRRFLEDLLALGFAVEEIGSDSDPLALPTRARCRIEAGSGPG